MDQKKIGRFIAQMRAEKCLTQARLGEMLGVSDKAVSKWENGKCLPDASLYKPLCRILDINLIELFDGERLEEGIEVRKADEVIHALAEESEKKSVFKLMSLVFSSVFMVLGIALLFIPQFLDTDKTYSLICVSAGLFALFLGAVIKILIWAHSRDKVIKNEGMGFCSMLTLVFIISKLTGTIDWPWIWVLAPLWASALLIVLLFLTLFAAGSVVKRLRGKKRAGHIEDAGGNWE